MLRLRLAPSEFWSMEPCHFWTLAETLGDEAGGQWMLDDEDKDELMAIIRAAEEDGA